MALAWTTWALGAGTVQQVAESTVSAPPLSLTACGQDGTGATGLTAELLRARLARVSFVFLIPSPF